MAVRLQSLFAIARILRLRLRHIDFQGKMHATAKHGKLKSTFEVSRNLPHN